MQECTRDMCNWFRISTAELLAGLYTDGKRPETASYHGTLETVARVWRIIALGRPEISLEGDLANSIEKDIITKKPGDPLRDGVVVWNAAPGMLADFHRTNQSEVATQELHK